MQGKVRCVLGSSEGHLITDLETGQIYRCPFQNLLHTENTFWQIQEVVEKDESGQPLFWALRRMDNPDEN